MKIQDQIMKTYNNTPDFEVSFSYLNDFNKLHIATLAIFGFTTESSTLEGIKEYYNSKGLEHKHELSKFSMLLNKSRNEYICCYVAEELNLNSLKDALRNMSSFGMTPSIDQLFDIIEKFNEIKN